MALLMDLPIEIRLMIWKYVLAYWKFLFLAPGTIIGVRDDQVLGRPINYRHMTDTLDYKVTKWPVKHRLGVAQINKQIRIEFLPLFWQCNSIAFLGLGDFDRFFKLVPFEMRSMFRKIEIFFVEKHKLELVESIRTQWHLASNCSLVPRLNTVDVPEHELEKWIDRERRKNEEQKLLVTSETEESDRNF